MGFMDKFKDPAQQAQDAAKAAGGSVGSMGGKGGEGGRSRHRRGDQQDRPAERQAPAVHKGMQLIEQSVDGYKQKIGGEIVVNVDRTTRSRCCSGARREGRSPGARSSPRSRACAAVASRSRRAGSGFPLARPAPSSTPGSRSATGGPTAGRCAAAPGSARVMSRGSGPRTTSSP